MPAAFNPSQWMNSPTWMGGTPRPQGPMPQWGMPGMLPGGRRVKPDVGPVYSGMNVGTAAQPFAQMNANRGFAAAAQAMPQGGQGGGGYGHGGGMPTVMGPHHYANTPDGKIHGGDPTLKPYAGVDENAALQKYDVPAFSGGTQDPRMSAGDVADWSHGLKPRGYADGTEPGMPAPAGVPAIMGERGPEMVLPMIGQFANSGPTPGQALINEGQRENVMPKPQMVGQNGPEMVVPQVPVAVVPNHALPPMFKRDAAGVPPGVDPRAWKQVARSPQFAAMAWGQQQQDQRMQTREGKQMNEKAQGEQDALTGMTAALKLAHPEAFTPQIEGALSRMKPGAAMAFLPAFAGHLAQQQKDQPAAMPTDVPEGFQAMPTEYLPSGKPKAWGLKPIEQPLTPWLMDVPGTTRKIYGAGRNSMGSIDTAPKMGPQSGMMDLPTGGSVLTIDGKPDMKQGVYDKRTLAGPMKDGYQMPTPVYEKRTEDVQDPVQHSQVIKNDAGEQFWLIQRKSGKRERIPVDSIPTPDGATPTSSTSATAPANNGVQAMLASLKDQLTKKK